MCIRDSTDDAPTWVSAPSGIVVTAEDATYSPTLSANDVDAGDVLSYALTTKPTGMTINSSSGLISWAPDNSQVGDHTITAKATDLSGAWVTRTWTVRVTNTASPISAPLATNFSPADAVIATADTFYLYEDTTYTLDLAAPDENIGTNSRYSITNPVSYTHLTLPTIYSV